MKERLKYLLVVVFLGFFITTVASGATCLFPSSGGTGKCTAVVGDIGKVLQVSNNSPLTYTFATPSGGISALTGDVTASGSGSVAATIANDAVTFAKMQNISTNRILGRFNSGTGDIEQATLTAGLEFASGSLRIANTTVTAGSYSYANITVNNEGRLTAASSGSAPTSTSDGITVFGDGGGTPFNAHETIITTHGGATLGATDNNSVRTNRDESSLVDDYLWDSAPENYHVGFYVGVNQILRINIPSGWTVQFGTLSLTSSSTIQSDVVGSSLEFYVVDPSAQIYAVRQGSTGKWDVNL